jgi:ribosome-binding factor A
MAGYRKNKIDGAFTEECARIIREVKDPRVSGAMISITGSDVSADLKYAKIYYSVYGECDEKELKKGLKSAAPFFRSRLAETINLRQTPEITFVRDEGMKRGAEISALIKKIEEEREKTPDEQ